MSHGPLGLGGGTFRPTPACCAIVYTAPISVSASASISPRLSLVFMFVLPSGGLRRPAKECVAPQALTISRLNARRTWTMLAASIPLTSDALRVMVVGEAYPTAEN